MTPADLLALLDAKRIPTDDAAREMGISRTTLDEYLNGRRFPSRGGRPLTKVPKWLAVMAESLPSR